MSRRRTDHVRVGYCGRWYFAARLFETPAGASEMPELLGWLPDWPWKRLFLMASAQRGWPWAPFHVVEEIITPLGRWRPA